MWGINETYELNTSSLILESNYTIQQNSPKNVLKTRFVITSVLMTFGLFGNTSIILVLKGFKGATSILTMYMAAFDSLSLISKVVGYGLVNYSKDFGYLFCTTSSIPMHFCVTTANWTLVLICIERFSSVFFPFQYRFIVSPRRVHVTMATLICTLFVYSILFNAMTQSYDDSSKRCIVINISSKIHVILLNCIGIAGPCLFTFSFTTPVIIRLKFVQTDFRQKSYQRQKSERLLMRLMLSSAILFVILSMPAFIYFIFISPFIQNEEIIQIVGIFISLLWDLSHTFNFVVYLIFVKVFRKTFAQIICKKSRKV
ncbi:N-arachidonyl glycine receptor-like [Biomphalaria glabrata]|uniref:N-arachidonyl glycine receptor-like n=1 Tax=Biomphalaria glabrata TaxID=6526 RepID=A0A9W3BPE4_BIOGL|nr:N-arachidonyl glycine receptor-like [Biomphalaria glabrata]